MADLPVDGTHMDSWRATSLNVHADQSGMFTFLSASRIVDQFKKNAARAMLCFCASNAPLPTCSRMNHFVHKFNALAFSSDPHFCMPYLQTVFACLPLVRPLSRIPDRNSPAELWEKAAPRDANFAGLLNILKHAVDAFCDEEAVAADASSSMLLTLVELVSTYTSEANIWRFGGGK